tara:strand:- start:392 stop:1030 length:639 start_codon:yes stop_codon:yes gene_type:complete
MENVVPVRKRLPEYTPSTILNSADFGVPQTRRRCFAGHGWEARRSHFESEWVSVIDALPHLKDELEELIPSPSMLKQYATASKNKPYPTVTSQSTKQLRLMVNTAGGGSSMGRRVRSADKAIQEPSLTIHNNQPSLRLIRLEALGSNAKRYQDHEKPRRIRSLTMSETLILQGFPSDFDLSAAKTQKSRWTMVGNAVCPPVAEAVIRGIIHD